MALAVVGKGQRGGYRLPISISNSLPTLGLSWGGAMAAGGEVPGPLGGRLPGVGDGAAGGAGADQASICSAGVVPV